MSEVARLRAERDRAVFTRDELKDENRRLRTELERLQRENAELLARIHEEQG